MLCLVSYTNILETVNRLTYMLVRKVKSNTRLSSFGDKDRILKDIWLSVEEGLTPRGWVQGYEGFLGIW